MRELKFVVMGSTGVGKSAITNQFVHGKFVEKYDPTIEDCYTKTVEVNGENCSIEILDTAGMEMFAAMRELYMKNGQGFVLVYSITSKISFEDLIKLRDKIVQVKQTSEVPMILVGNKCDLDKTERVISTERGKAMAVSWGCPFLESSAKTNENIQNIFFELIAQVDKFQRNQELLKQAVGNQQGTGESTRTRVRHKKKHLCSDCQLL